MPIPRISMGAAVFFFFSEFLGGIDTSFKVPAACWFNTFRRRLPFIAPAYVLVSLHIVCPSVSSIFVLFLSLPSTLLAFSSYLGVDGDSEGLAI
jgi:hypothetical protein